MTTAGKILWKYWSFLLTQSFIVQFGLFILQPVQMLGWVILPQKIPREYCQFGHPTYHAEIELYSKGFGLSLAFSAFNGAKIQGLRLGDTNQVKFHVNTGHFCQHNLS